MKMRPGECRVELIFGAFSAMAINISDGLGISVEKGCGGRDASRGLLARTDTGFPCAIRR